MEVSTTGSASGVSLMKSKRRPMGMTSLYPRRRLRKRSLPPLKRKHWRKTREEQRRKRRIARSGILTPTPVSLTTLMVPSLSVMRIELSVESTTGFMLILAAMPASTLRRLTASTTLFSLILLK